MPDALTSHVSIIPATPASWPWILHSFRHQIGGIDGGPSLLAESQRRALERILRGGIGPAVVAVPVGFPTEFLGWAVAVDGRVLYAYVRSVFRRQGVGAQLVCAVTDRVPVEVAYWTPEAQAIADHGWPIRYEIQAYRTLLAFTHERTA